MTTRTEPTPQPWLWGPSAVKANHFDIIDEETESTLATVESEEFAALVVREHRSHAALVEALEGLLWPNVPSRKDVAILAAMSNAGPEVMALVDKIGTAQEKGREALAAAKVTP